MHQIHINTTREQYQLWRWHQSLQAVGEFEEHKAENQKMYMLALAPPSSHYLGPWQSHDFSEPQCSFLSVKRIYLS